MGSSDETGPLVIVGLLILAVFIGFALWAKTVEDRKKRDRGADGAGPAVRKSVREWPARPDIGPALALFADGAPATERQRAAVRVMEIGIDPADLTADAAHIVLSCRGYAEGVVYAHLGRTGNYLNEREIEGHLACFIIADDDLRERAVKWSNRSYARGSGRPPQPKKDVHFKRVDAEFRRLLHVLAG